jgi:hypothetical protein
MSFVGAFASASFLLPSSSSLPSVGPQADDTPGGLHINMWYLLSGLGTLITASKCKIESSLPDMPQALSRKADQRFTVLAVILVCPPGRKFLRWLGWLRESPGQLRRRAEGIAGWAHAASQREPPPAESHGPPEETLSGQLWGQAAAMFEEAERREREGWGEYLGGFWRDFSGGAKRVGGELGGSCVVCLWLCWLSLGKGVGGVGGGRGGVAWGEEGKRRGVRGDGGRVRSGRQAFPNQLKSTNLRSKLINIANTLLRPILFQHPYSILMPPYS